jgi:hypothetical protein
MDNNKNAAAAGRASLVFGAALLASLVVSGLAFGQQPGGLRVDVGECVKLESPGERLDCYERQVKRAQTAPVAPPPAVVPPPPAAAPPSVAAPRAAAPAPAAPSAPAARDVRVEDARVANDPPSSGPALRGTITALRETVPNRWLITLENGQMWRQTYAEPYPLRIGQRVEVSKSGRRSSYQLAAVGLNGDIQVEPVR